MISIRSFVLIDQQNNTESDNNKVQKHVTFSEDENIIDIKSTASTVRNFFMMESSTPEQKPNFMVGGDIDLEETEEKDEFPPRGITKQISDAGLIDKRRRLR